MSKRVQGLSGLLDHYDVIYSDVWGVLHNGVAAWPTAVEALRNARQRRIKIVLISNSPRPSPSVRKQLEGLGVPANAYDDIVTSGDVTRGLFENEYRGRQVAHIGPPKDTPLVEGLPVTFVADEEAEICLCSGLMDDTVEGPEDYRGRLTPMAKRNIPMVCANPDKVVEMGDKLIYCAGALADLYEELGGETIVLGKPFAPIYEATARLAGNPAKSRVLALGDSVRTDLRGAADQGIDCLFFTGGIHAGEFGEPEDPDPPKVNAFLDAAPYPAIGWMPRLSW